MSTTKNILCSECDNRLGRYEDYASLIFKGGESINIKSEKGNGIVIHHISGIDYKKFKLFLLSLLWKTSISSREAYQYLTLSPEEVDIKAKITDEVKPGILSSTFHFPDIMLNNITSSISDTETMCPEYKVVACTIRKSKGKSNNESL